MRTNKKLRNGLVLLTLVSVIADSMLLPFYPQFFSVTFDQHSPEHVGVYIAASCFTVMITFPIWARIAKKVNELHLWVYTQLISGLLGISCFFVDSLVWFWVLSQTMLIFKASYLLIYPFVMRLEKQDAHLGVASLFSVLMHFGAISGAIIGGAFLEHFNPRGVYLLMSGTDAAQVIMCLILIRIHNVPLFQSSESFLLGENESSDEVLQTNTSAEFKSEISPTVGTQKGTRFLYQLSIVSLLFYCSAFLIRPFFSTYWQTVSEVNNIVIAALIYSIPGWVAIIGLWFNHRRQGNCNHYRVILSSLCLAVIGVLLQGVEHTIAIIVGRCIFGWALFQITVRLEVVMFEFSHKDDYGVDFSKIYLFQNIGILIASISVGSLVSNTNSQAPFIVSFIGFLVTAVVFTAFFKKTIFLSHSSIKEVQSA